MPNDQQHKFNSSPNIIPIHQLHIANTSPEHHRNIATKSPTHPTHSQHIITVSPSHTISTHHRIIANTITYASWRHCQQITNSLPTNSQQTHHHKLQTHRQNITKVLPKQYQRIARTQSKQHQRLVITLLTQTDNTTSKLPTYF